MEDLAFRRLLDFYYLHEQPIKQRDIARQIGMRDHEQDVLTVLNEFFISTDAGFVNPRADKEIAHYHSKIEQASRAGKASAERRSNARSTDVQPTSNHEPVTSNHEPINSVAKATGDRSPLTTDEIIFGYGVPLLTNAGTPDKQARSFLGGLRKAHGDEALVNTLRECIRAKPLQPLEWIAAVLPPKGTKPRNQPMSFAQQDELARRKRWEEMTGRKWPEADQPNFIDVTPTTLEIEK
jgi:uncharacterized protein YdaU (DUF1376 family)